MDTRTKIVDLDGAAAAAAAFRGRGVKWKLVTGYFDVLTPERVRALCEIADGAPLMAVVLDPPDALLPSRARAELAASLRVIDRVILLSGADLERCLAVLRPDELIRAEQADHRRTQDLIQHVHSRNK